MRFDWQQLSPRERQFLVRHFLFRANTPANVTPEKVCALMQKTHHHLTCYTTKDGKAVIEFVTKRGVRSGVSTADTLAEGIFKAALRAKGVEVVDEALPRLAERRRTSVFAHA
jgi:hypothetical protein